MTSPRCIVTLACNNLCDPLIKEGASSHIKYPMSLMRKLVAEHGLGYHVDLGESSIVFDTGGTLKTFLPNMKAIEPDWSKVKCMAFSHGHHDHVGGLISYLAVRKEMNEAPVDIIMHPAALAIRYRIRDEKKVKEAMPIHSKEVPGLLESGAISRHESVKGSTIERLGGKLKLDTDPVPLNAGLGPEGISISTAGEIPRIREKSFHPEYYLVESGGELRKDTYLDDQPAFITVDDQYVIILLGCCHAGLENTIERVRDITSLPVKAIIGGFHLLAATEAEIHEKHEYLEGVAHDLVQDASRGPLILRPTHCSGERFYLHLKQHASTDIDIARCPVGTQIVIR